MNVPRCTVCGQPIRLALVSRDLDRWEWVHEAQPPPSPHRAAHAPVPHTID